MSTYVKSSSKSSKKLVHLSYLTSRSFPDRQLSIYDDYDIGILRFVACFDPIVVELERPMARVKISDQPRRYYRCGYYT